MKYNPTRRALGIRELPKNWFTYDTSQKPGIWNGRTRGKQDIFWLNQVWIPIDPKVSGHYEKEIRKTSETLIYEKDRFRKVINDSLEYILEVKYNYKYDPKKEVKLLKNYSEKGGYKIDIQDFEWSKLDSLVKWITL